MAEPELKEKGPSCQEDGRKRQFPFSADKLPGSLRRAVGDLRIPYFTVQTILTNLADMLPYNIAKVF